MTTFTTPLDIVMAITEPEAPPRAAIEAAANFREGVTGLLLEAFNDFLLFAPEERSDVPMPLAIGALLLAEWRVTALCRPLLKILRLPIEQIEPQFSDMITESMPQIVASVYDGDPQPLFEAIGDPDAYEFVRWSLCDALLILLRFGRVERDDAAAFAVAWVKDPANRAAGGVWMAMTDVVAALRLEETKEEFRLAHEDGRIEPNHQTWDDFESVWAEWIQGPASPPEREDDRLRLFDGTADYVDGWNWDEPERDGETEPEPRPSSGAGPAVQLANPYRHVGRNDPCPCGSGKKFKKCCLPKAEAWG